MGAKASYPSVYESNRRSDFIVQHLGELEMMCTIFSPALSGFVLAALWAAYGTDQQASKLTYILVISVTVTVQALLPFVQKTEKCGRLTEIASFVALPIPVTIVCIMFLNAEEGEAFVSWSWYTISIQVMLVLVFLGKRFCCAKCCASARRKEKTKLLHGRIGQEESEKANNNM